ncbi:hypothetical protein [Sorangium sp. So ce854]|uniref:hypothetical protein n=1 Tax=Sorangium sp. So ce854 TaxID=3133322 RepID=UPI003F5FC0A6
MSRSNEMARRGFRAAVLHKLVALVTMAAVLSPSFAWAGTPYRLDWVSIQYNANCLTPKLSDPGAAYFSVNQTPLPTYEVPGEYMVHGDGTESNRMEAAFDSVLLRMGRNDVHFKVASSAGLDACIDAREVVSLVSEPLGLNKPLFDVRRDGTGFEGSTDVDLSLAEINPNLARAIAELEVRVARLMTELLRDAARVADLGEKMDLLRQLDTELHDLVQRPLDEISRTDLDAILDRYKDVVDAETRAAMQQLVDDLKKSVNDLESELALAEQMKDGLNLWTGGALDLEQTQLYQTISAFAGAMSTVGEGVEAYAGVMQTLVHATTRIGVGFVPVVGPALDLCEAVTGKAWCLPSGQELSDEERIFSGVGFGLGAVGPVWRAVSRAGGLTPDAIRVAEEIAQLGEELATALRAPRRTWYKTLRGAVTSKPLDAMEKRAAKFMLDDGRALIGVGDDGVRRVLDIPKESPPSTTLGRAPDFLTVTKGNKLALTEVKDIDSATGKVDIDHALTQLENAMKKLSDKGLAGDVERIEFIIPKGAPLKNENKIVKDGYLVDALTGKRIKLESFGNLVMVIQL